MMPSWHDLQGLRPKKTGAQGTGSWFKTREAVWGAKIDFGMPSQKLKWTSIFFLKVLSHFTQYSALVVAFGFRAPHPIQIILVPYIRGFRPHNPIQILLVGFRPHNPIQIFLVPSIRGLRLGSP